MVAQNNGKYFVAGGSGSNRTIRYLADATVDPIFDAGSGFDGAVSDLGLRLDGKIWVGGSFNNYNGSAASKLTLLSGDPVPLALTSEPDSMVLDPGQDATFSASAVGTSAISYQWQKDGVSLSDGGRISGATTWRRQLRC